MRERTQSDAEESIRRDQREEARRRFRLVEAKRREYLEAVEEFEELLTIRSAAAQRLGAVTEAISKARAASAVSLGDRLGDLTQAGLSVTVDHTPLGDRAALIAYLDDRLLSQERAGQYRAQKTAERLAKLGTPAELAEALMREDQVFITGGGNSVHGLRASEAERLLGALVWTFFDEDADVRIFTAVLDELVTLSEQPIDDSISIRLNGEAVNDLSPGQRSSAMLPLIALAESVPLVIDQPEDNLDNRMVGSTLRRVLAELKERRQIIVCTHNPNIVVGGDAEQVVVLEPDAGGHARVDRTGSIDDERVVDAVIGIMEGGAEAFRERGRRYGERLGPNGDRAPTS